LRHRVALDCVEHPVRHHASRLVRKRDHGVLRTACLPALEDLHFSTRERMVAIGNDGGGGRGTMSSVTGDRRALERPTSLAPWPSRPAGVAIAPRLFDELTLARADGTYAKLLARFARTDVLVLDDWGLAPVQDAERRDLLEIMEDRHGLRSTIWTSQLPVAKWHDHLGDPTVADAICDRLLHNAHRIVLQGPSRRKTEANKD
jgi:hypothetical protein